MKSVLSVAVLTRGTGAYSYTYSCATELVRGDICALSFRGSLELGVVVGVDDDPPSRDKLLPLIPVTLPGREDWGRELSDLASLFAATPREIVGYYLFTTPTQGLKISLILKDAGGIDSETRGVLADLCGKLTPARRKKLMHDVGWEQLYAAVTGGAVALEAAVTGLPGVTRPQGKYSKQYTVDPATAKLLGLLTPPAQPLPGTYLAGLTDNIANLNLSPVRPAQVAEAPGIPKTVEPKLNWQPLEWPREWELLAKFPEIAGIKLRRIQATWDHLRDSRGLPAELTSDIARGNRTLLIAPMAWMLERIWPALGLWAGHVHRYRSEAGPSAVSAVLTAMAAEGQVVCGLAGAWKLAAYCRFDRVILIDPTHPGYQPEGAPWLDSRLALWKVMAGSGARLDIVELGLSAFDGTTQLRQAAIMPAHEPEKTPQSPGKFVDIDPLPLHLRQPGRRRLVYFNRLGQGRGLRCAECGLSVNCPQCSSSGIHYSGRRGQYFCPDCGWSNPDLLCRNCGTATLSSTLPGLEALTRRSGDTLVHSGSRRGVHPENQSVFGTATLLEPLAEFWPQEIVYVHADTKPGLMDDWHFAVDLISRLCALYANPQLQYAYIVSAQLRGKLGNSLIHGQIAKIFEQDFMLRKLAGLPPYGRLLKLRWWGNDRSRVLAAARSAMAAIGRDTPDAMLGLGKPYPRRDGFQLTGYAVNPEIDDIALQRLRFGHRDVSLSIRVVIGPWGD